MEAPTQRRGNRNFSFYILNFNFVMLQSIEHQSGLPIAFDPSTNTIHWSEGVGAGETRVRTLGEMRDYIREPDAQAPTDAVYTVYRNTARRDDRERIAAAGLRYDITIIPPGSFFGVRKEFLRTAGHYHPRIPGSEMAYPEVYEVIAGRAYWLVQRHAPGNPENLEEVYLVEAGPGEKAIMLPGFGHLAINVRPEPLVMANWIANSFAYDYAPYRQFRGGGYWALEGETSETVEFQLNTNYAQVAELKKLRPREVPPLGLLRSQPLYGLAGDLGKLRFLSDPAPLAELLSVDTCYRAVV